MRREHTVHKLFGLLLRSVVISLYKLKMGNAYNQPTDRRAWIGRADIARTIM
jgi:hypothetical protein